MDGKELVRRIIDEIVNKGEFDAADELIAEDFIDHGPIGDTSGREAFKQMVGQFRAAVPAGNPAWSVWRSPRARSWRPWSARAMAALCVGAVACS